jgi:F-type H+-transporting ATPase subunit c
MENIKFLAAAIALIPFLGVSSALGKIFSSSADAIARNPSARGDIRSLTLIGASFAEAGGLFCFLIALLILFV